MSEFREKIGIFRLANKYTYEDEQLLAIRQIIFECQPGLASFDEFNPGADSLKSWQFIEKWIDSDIACGLFHTHPSGLTDFSEQDWRLIRGFAKAYGDKLLWHVMQTEDNMFTVRCVAAHMINKQVIIHDFGFINCFVEDTVIKLPIPRTRVSCKNGAIVINEYKVEEKWIT